VHVVVSRTRIGPESSQTSTSVAGTAIAGMAAGAGGSAGTHPAAGSTLVATALKTKHRQHLLNVARVALGATHGFVAPEDQPFKFFTAFAAFVFVNGHVFLHYLMRTVRS
jgi:hypothetical protein